ncbi:S-adenosyl-L-methionine-dependent methyltransferase [Poronia punctata]|nr:S-adenosyl-L-methionine-dependent methyltransferase [Poronia punctata]
METPSSTSTPMSLGPEIMTFTKLGAGMVFKNESAPQLWLDEDGVDLDQFTDTSDTEYSSNPDDCGLQGVNTPSPGKLSRRVTVDLPVSTLAEPKSLFEGFEPPAPEEREWRAVATLLESVGSKEPDDYYELELDNFSIYVDMYNFSNELRPLQHLSRVPCMYFDGILRHGDKQFFVRRVPFEKLPVGNYGESNHTVGDQIWILSKLNELKWDRTVYYKLLSPAPEYRRYHTPFMWIADLAKHVIDYCEYRRDQDQGQDRIQDTRVRLEDFRSLFGLWCQSQHGTDDTFKRWYSANGGNDFRGAIIANVDYIWREAHGLDPNITKWHHLWGEIKTLDYYRPNLISSQEDTKSPGGNTEPNTVVTPYIHNLFSHMVFGNLLESTEACATANVKQAQFLQENQSFSKSFRSPKHNETDHAALVASIQPGDVISTEPDGALTDTKWKREPSNHYQGDYLWFGLVQKVHRRSDRQTSFDVLWLYQPVDTPCSVMKYPWDNELFLSDNCTCHHQTAKVKGDQILAVHEVEFFGTPSTSAEYFVRQTYVASDCRWASLREEHLKCGDETAFSQSPTNEIRYRVGDTVLAHTQTQSSRLDTFIVESLFTENKKELVRLRRLLRRREVDKDARSAPPNELVYSHQLVETASKRIDRRCLVRSFCVGEDIPPPYNRNGTGDAFFITHEEFEIDGVIQYRPLEPTRLGSFRQGYDVGQDHKTQKLRGLDLFCGGGNFGRGIEESGAVEMHWTNDIWEGAIHTYMANSPSDNTPTPFLGSVDDLLRLGLKGVDKVPAPGDVQFISAGSPCPGFSSLTIDKTSPHQRKNQSLVASFASFVDFYRPLYGLLENVPRMVNSSGFRDSCVFSQLVCALVGLGYQVQVMFLDAWSFGSSQNRTRVFLAFTAPGLRTPKAPTPSHSHPEDIPLQKLGVMSCGRPFDSRKRVPTPFTFVPIRDAVGDLPNIQDSKADYCIGYPDHRLSIGYTCRIRKQLFQIPTQPYGLNFSQAWYGGLMTSSERLLFPEKTQQRTMKHSKAWGRVHPKKLVGTIATRCSPTDGRTGRINHWAQNRPLTILEVRRAQGFLDTDVLVGTAADQWKIIGNSVCRHVAQVLGLAIREAWLGSLFDENAKIDVDVGNIHVEKMHVDVEEVHVDVVGSDLAAVLPLDPDPVPDTFCEIQGKRSLSPSSLYIETLAKKCRVGED